MFFQKTNLFKHFYISNNKLIGSISFSNLMNEYIIIPNIQRIRDNNKVESIVEYQSNYFKKKQCFNFQGLINIHCCSETNNNYLVDGQHRYFSVKKLMEIYGDEHYIDIECICVSSINELKENYMLINKNTQLPEFKNYDNKDIVDEISLYFFQNYPKIWTQSKRPKRPYINKNHFQEGIEYLYDNLKTNLKNNRVVINPHYLINIIENKNKKMKQWPIQSYEKNIRKIKNWPEYIELANNHGFYLGMYSNISQEFCYKWIQELIQEETGIIIKKKTTKTKKSIPKKIKEDVWDKWVGENEGISLCYCCRKTKLSKSNFVCGHVLSENNGGTISIDNMRPICNSCNLSMKTKHMFEYIKEYYPNNAIAFKNNKPPIIKSKKNWFF